MIRTPPVQSPTMTISQYFNSYLDYMAMRGFLQNDSTNLNNKNELDLFIGGCVHSIRLFYISREDWLSTDPIMLQQFVQGSAINTLTFYLRELELPDGPSRSIHYSSRYSEESDSGSEDERKSKSKLRN